MSLRNYILGTASYTVTGADPGSCVNRLTQQDIPIWDLQEADPLSYTFRSYQRQEERILALTERSYCQGSCSDRRGLKQDLFAILRRPMLVLSLVGAMILSFLMEGLIWGICIDVEDPLVAGQISHVLQDMGIAVWGSSRKIDTEEVRYALLNRIPTLSWVAVNPKGGRLTILALCRDNSSGESETTPCNLVACREGVITESIVLEGMPLVKRGESVRAGQILVSGVEDYGIYLKTVRSAGEIYARTWHRGVLVTPSKEGVKDYTGRIFREINLIVGRKFINLSRSSSILGGTCDKIVDTKQLSLPGYPFPLCLQRVTYREYTIRQQSLPRDRAVELLCGSWQTCLLSSMVAGRVEQTDSDCFEEGGVYIFRGESICHELISRLMDLEPLMKGEDPIGTDH